MTVQTSIEVPILLRLLKGIDKLPKGATGALVFTAKNAPQGTVLVEDNRVCWAAASNMEHGLTDILRHESDPPLPKETSRSSTTSAIEIGSPWARLSSSAGS